MARKYSLLPSLTDQEKAWVGSYLRALLGSPRLTGGRWPLSNGRLSLYVDGVASPVCAGTWQIGNGGVYLASETAAVQLLDRLAVIAMIAGVAGLWSDEMVGLFSTAVSRTMLESYNEMMHGLVMARGSDPAVALAFSADRQQVAARMGDGWYLPNGLTAEVDDSWVVLEQ